MVLTVGVGLIAIEFFERGGAVAEESVGASQANRGGGVVPVETCFLFGDLAVELCLFQIPKTHLTPGGYGHRLDQLKLDAGFGLEFVLKMCEVSGEVVGGLGFEGDGLGADAMAEGVA